MSRQQKIVMGNHRNVFYFPSNNTIDIVLLNSVDIAYPLHTHAEHYTMGIVVEGKILIETDNEQHVCGADEIFTIPMDVPHSIKPFEDVSYTMLVFCIHQDYLIQTGMDDIKWMIGRKLNLLIGEKEMEDR